MKLYLKMLWILSSSDSFFSIKKLHLVGFKKEKCCGNALSASSAKLLNFFFFFFKDSLLFTPKCFLKILLQIKIAFPSGGYMVVGIMGLGLSILEGLSALLHSGTLQPYIILISLVQIIRIRVSENCPKQTIYF